MKVKVVTDEEFAQKHPRYRPKKKSKSELRREEYMRQVAEKKKRGENF